MELENKVKHAMEHFILQQNAEYEQNDEHHKINITEPEFGHIIIDIKEHKMEVNK